MREIHFLMKRKVHEEIRLNAARSEALGMAACVLIA